MNGIRTFINNLILNKVLKHYKKDAIKYKSTMHNCFRERGYKTYGRFDIIYTLLTVIKTRYNHFLGIRTINLDEDEEKIIIDMRLNKPSKLLLYKDEIIDDLTIIFKKKVEINVKYCEKLYGIDFYKVD